jgi:hypothetical protein
LFGKQFVVFICVYLCSSVDSIDFER